MHFLNPTAFVNFEMMGTSELISCILLLYVQPLLCIVGILFNSACLGIFVMVWNNRQYYRKTALILYLGAVSVCSIAQLLLSFPVIVMPAVEQFIDDVKYPEEARVINDFNVRAVKMFYPLLMAANYVSIWLLVLVCAHRFHSICHPNSVWKGRLQFVCHSKLCIFIAIFAAIAVNAIRWFEMEKIGSKSLENGQLVDSELRLLYGLAVYTVPMCLLVWLNYNTMRIITESSERRQQFQSRLPAEHRTALMTICVFCAFALCTTMAISLRLVILLLSFPVIVMPAVEQFIDDVKYPEEARVINDFNVRAVKMFYPLLMAANYVSIWLLVLVCAHRFHSICHPNSVWKGRLQFVCHSKLCIFIAIFAAIAVNAIRWFEMEKIGSKSLENGQLVDSVLRLSLLYNIVQEGLLYGLAVYIVPMCLLVWLNYNTMRIITESSERRQQFQSRLPAEHRTALMTICVFCAFALCTTMAISLRLVIIVVGNMFEYAEFAWLPDVSNLLMNINTIVMPIVFFIFTRGFRDLFFALHHRATNANANRFKLPK
uniref:G_PROTEIN_RECEP_F1_2 domain-containing protein n=1 Tax=Globodera pallida TaxID=36090 RepID=A0A183CI60_GLOPA